MVFSSQEVASQKALDIYFGTAIVLLSATFLSRSPNRTSDLLRTKVH